jgi:PhzF family phenazine biosynthesis protein
LGSRPLWVNTGKEQLVVPLTSVEAVRRAAPRAEAFTNLASEDGLPMAYVFAPGGVAGIESRFFFPQGTAMLEDPATGSAAANLGGWLLATQAPLPIALRISQGDQTGRPSTLHLDVDRERRIFVGGDVVEIGRGSVTLEAQGGAAGVAGRAG